MILKSFLVEKNISIIDEYPIVLFYGENIGLKDDFKFEIRKKYNDFEKISFNQDEILKNENLLDEQIYNVFVLLIIQNTLEKVYFSILKESYYNYYLKVMDRLISLKVDQIYLIRYFLNMENPA